jgi:hypothetical protein
MGSVLLGSATGLSTGQSLYAPWPRSVDIMSQQKLPDILSISSGLPQHFLKHCYLLVGIVFSVQCVGAILGWWT